MAIAAAAAALTLGAAACGEEEESEVVEGEPIELGDLRFNVQLTRFLNTNDPEDSEYLQDLPQPPAGEDYLAVFMDVENEGGDDLPLPGPGEIEVKDTTGAAFEPIETDSLFALELGETIPSGGEVPEADTAAAAGPVQGSFLLFLLPQSASENRPLELELHADGEDGIVELDI